MRRRANQVVISASVLMLIAATTMASTVIDSVTVIVDKVKYSSDYVAGLTVYTHSDDPSITVGSVSAQYTPSTGGSFGSWSLNPRSSATWWAWSPNYIPLSEGPVSGAFHVSVTDSLGNVGAQATAELPAGAELGLVQDLHASTNPNGYHVEMAPVPGAELYRLWVWDPVEGRYPFSASASDPSLWPVVPFKVLIPGRQYAVYGIAQHNFSAGPCDPSSASVFRSYDVIHISDASSVPLPYALWSGLGVLGMLSIRHLRLSARD